MVILGRVTENGSALEDVPQFLQHKWLGTVTNDPSRSVQYLSVLIAVPSGLILVSEDKPVCLGKKFTVKINEECTVLVVKKRRPRNMYNLNLIRQGHKLILGNDGSDGENITLSAMMAKEELKTLRGKLGKNSEEAIETKSYLKLQCPCEPDVNMQHAIACADTGGVFVMVILLVKNSLQKDRTSAATSHNPLTVMKFN
jgi:hypothetical protein